MTLPGFLQDLRKTVDDLVSKDSGNFIADPQTLSTAPYADGPLRLFDAPLIGVADARDPLWARLKEPDVVGPHHLMPEDWLAGARSVVSFFFPASKTVRMANRIKGITATEWLYARHEGQMFINATADLVVKLVDSVGGRALAPSRDSRFRVVERRSNWSERHAGFVAGLGTFSLSRSIITNAGSAGRLTSVVTDLELPPTLRAYTDYDEYCNKCGFCIDRCPPCAIALATGKDNQICSDYVDETEARFDPRYGCGKCQTAVPCESRIPAQGGAAPATV